MNFVKVLLFILFAIALPILGIPGNNADQGDATCLTCHENMYNLALNRRYIHNSFLKKNCRTCHVEKNAATTNEGDDQASEGISSKITWLQNHYEPAATHFFLIPSNRVDDTLFVKMKSTDGGTTTTSLSLPPLETLPRLINDGRQPEIFDIQFQGVKHGVLSSATVSWKTDEPTDSQIHSVSIRLP